MLRDGKLRCMHPVHYLEQLNGLQRSVLRLFQTEGAQMSLRPTFIGYCSGQAVPKQNRHLVADLRICLIGRGIPCLMACLVTSQAMQVAYQAWPSDI